MQNLLMTDMMSATADFKPNGHPKDTARAHRMALRQQRKEERQARKTGWNLGSRTSKPTVWRWLERYLDEGVGGLRRDKTRASSCISRPQAHPG